VHVVEHREQLLVGLGVGELHGGLILGRRHRNAGVEAAPDAGGVFGA
jgi:hypothetical protein